MKEGAGCGVVVGRRKLFCKTPGSPGLSSEVYEFSLKKTFQTFQSLGFFLNVFNMLWDLYLFWWPWDFACFCFFVSLAFLPGGERKSAGDSSRQP